MENTAVAQPIDGRERRRTVQRLNDGRKNCARSRVRKPFTVPTIIIDKDVHQPMVSLIRHDTKTNILNIKNISGTCSCLTTPLYSISLHPDHGVATLRATLRVLHCIYRISQRSNRSTVSHGHRPCYTVVIPMEI